LQWLQNPNQSNVDNLNNVRYEASKHLRGKKRRNIRKLKLKNLKLTVKNIRDLYRGISDFKYDYQPRTNIAKDEKGDLFTDCHIILGMWKKHFSQLLNVHGVSDVRQTDIHTAEPLVPQPSTFEVEMAIEKLKRHRSPGID